MKYRVLFNPKADSYKGETNAKEIESYIDKKDIEYISVLDIKDYKKLFESFSSDDKIVICGGDGTINHYINDTHDIKYNNSVYLYACGTGNDFLYDIGKKKEDGLVEITKYLKYYPYVIINGKKSYFINGIGYGIDGYCCQVGDQQREAGVEKIDYTAIAIKGLLGDYHPVNAKVEIDGQHYQFKKVWLAPSMFGRYYGGGMMATPEQDRLSEKHYVTFMCWHKTGKLKTLICFPNIFKGTHVKHSECIKIVKAKHVVVEFDRPTALQIDGETVLDVTKYEVFCE